MGKSSFSNKIKENELTPGDHIYSYRRAYSFSHHGIFVGDGSVIHYTGTDEDRPSFNIKGLCRRNCGFDPNGNHGVVLSCLDCFLSDHSLYRYEYEVSETWFALKRSGSCTTRPSDPPEDVLKRAYLLLNEKGFGNYNLFENNSENFATFCKTGQGISSQMESVTRIVVNSAAGIVFHKLLKYDCGKEMKMTDPRLQKENAVYSIEDCSEPKENVVYRIRDRPETDEEEKEEEEDDKVDEDEDEEEKDEEREREMGKSSISYKIKENELQPGDHIYSYRRAHIFSHHGIYVGNGRVIHYTRTDEDRPSFNINEICRRACGFNPRRHHGVVLSCLGCFLSGHSLRRFEYGVSETWFALKRSGTCATHSSDSPEDVLKRAYLLLNENGFGNYNLFENNCENFATFCKMGQRISSQIKSVTTVAAEAAIAIVLHKLQKYDYGKELKMTDRRLQKKNAAYSIQDCPEAKENVVYRIRDRPESDEDEKEGEEDEVDEDKDEEEKDGEDDYNDYDDNNHERYLKDEEEEEEKE
ncbi:LRAT domain [Dillenia turbinata]|uniref:LRAT domain n=1 Tax=Dillenia turbinata TaxID=194707 RepID=A0AAN8ZG25_9MAGN